MNGPDQTSKKRAVKPQHRRPMTLRYVLRGHEKWLWAVSWSPDGRTLASASDDGTVRLWNAGAERSRLTLKGHSSTVHSVAWSPDGRTLASAAGDQTIRLWDVSDGSTRAVLQVHEINSIAWSPDGQTLALASGDGTIGLWDAGTRREYLTLRVRGGDVHSVAWSPDGRLLASASEDGNIGLWDARAGDIWQELEGHTVAVHSVAWSPDGRRLASASEDQTVRLWHPKSEQPLSILEGHSEIVTAVSFSYDGRLLASIGYDDTVRLWRVNEPGPPAILKGAYVNNIGPCLAFHPTEMLLAAPGKDSEYSIHIWQASAELPKAVETAGESVWYTTAKIVLVGDSGVGKTGLGWRLAHGEFKEQASTHGQQFWVIDELRNKREDGTECEAVLWDLAGQAVYRPVHAIFLNDVDLSLVLFDPTNRAEPLKGAQFWLEQLAGKEKKLPPSVLVGARTDRGEAALSKEELEQFCQRYGISGGYISTSAKSGEGLDGLLETIKAQIPWERMTTTVTTVTFKRVKEYVLSLKEKPDRRGVLVRPDELRAQLEATDKDWKFTDAEMMTAVKHLETHGYVSVLRSSSGEEVILLTPDVLVGLASSIVLLADKHPQDLGALSETELLKGGYDFPELATLEKDERQILLDAAVVRFMSHNICFRETLGADTLLIFPTLIKQKRPLFDEVETAEDVSYVVRGRVENVYAALVVLLGYTRTFTRVNQWQSQAQYQMGGGEICGFRLIEEREGEIELVIYYSAAMPSYGRTGFQGLFEQFLYQRDVEVTRFPPVACPSAHRQERATVVKRIREGKEFIFCDECGQKIPLPEIERPLALGAQDARWVRRAEAEARLRSAYETHLVRVKGFRRDRAAPRCYVSHLPEQASWVAQLVRDLREAGVFVLDDLARVRETDFVVVACAPAYRQAFEAAGGPLADDAELIRGRLASANDTWPTVIPLLLKGHSAASLPPEMQGLSRAYFRDETRRPVSLFDLVLTLYAIPLNHPAFKPQRESLDRQWQTTLAGEAGPGRQPPEAAAEAEVFISYAWDGESEAVAEKLVGAFQDRGVRVVRDKQDLGFKGRIREFMERIGRGRCVVLVISRKYLESPNCWFELLQVAKNGDFYERVFPVVLEDAQIYDPAERLRYVKYWEKKKRELNRGMKGVAAENMDGFREDIDLYAEIRKQLPGLTDVLRDMNALTPEMHAGSNFTELFEAVMAKLSEE